MHVQGQLVTGESLQTFHFVFLRCVVVFSVHGITSFYFMVYFYENLQLTFRWPFKKKVISYHKSLVMQL